MRSLLALLFSGIIFAQSAVWVTVQNAKGEPITIKLNLPLLKKADGSYTLTTTTPPDLSLTQVDPLTFSIGGRCSIPTPCKARVKGVVYTYTVGALVTVSPGVTTALRIYVSDGSDDNPVGSIQVANPIGFGVTCDSQCSVSHSTQFAGIPIAAYDTSTHLIQSELTTLSTQ